MYLVAKVKQAKDIGSIINAEKEIDKNISERLISKSTNNNPIMWRSALTPVTVIAGTFGLNLKRTRLNPSVADAPIPHIVPSSSLGTSQNIVTI